MEFEVKERASLEDGLHKGVITKIEYRDDPYAYTDIYIRPLEREFELKYGCPSNLTEGSKLGKLLMQFTDLKVGEKIDPEKILVDRKVKFMAMQEKGKDGNIYTRIVDDSVKPE